MWISSIYNHLEGREEKKRTSLSLFSSAPLRIRLPHLTSRRSSPSIAFIRRSSSSSPSTSTVPAHFGGICYQSNSLSSLDRKVQKLQSSMANFGGINGKQKEAIEQAFRAINRLKEDNFPSKIEEGLFLGSLGAATNRGALMDLNITHILTVAHRLVPAYPTEYVYKRIEVADSIATNLTQHFSECFDFIDEAKRKGGAVLVHCVKGRSRSVSIVVAYLMKTSQMSLSQALEYVTSRRPQAHPNNGFIRQLFKFEISLQVNKDVNTSHGRIQAEPTVLDVMDYDDGSVDDDSS